jgi:hypothetical protein
MRKIAQAGLGIAALALAAPAHADLPGIAPFVGDWGIPHTGYHINIQSEGNGRWTYPDTRTCPNAPVWAGCGVTGTTDFTLTSVDRWGTASGTVTASTDPIDGAAVDSNMFITPFSAGETPWRHGTGTGLAVYMGRLHGENFCNQISADGCTQGS